jgi:energy-coupling factor transporter ATP-binding protein EcfA2
MNALTIPQQGERGFALGNSGSGKTTLLRSIFGVIQNGIVIDTKQDDSTWGVFGEVVKGDDIYNCGAGRWIWQPENDLTEDEAEAERFFDWLLSVGNRLCLCDELGDICASAQRYPLAFKRCYTRGRSRRLSMFGGTQEPIRVPSFCFGQAQHRYVFYLGHPDQRDAAEHYMESELPWEKMQMQYSESGKPLGSSYVYRNPYGLLQGPYKLEVPKHYEERISA